MEPSNSSDRIQAHQGEKQEGVHSSKKEVSFGAHKVKSQSSPKIPAAVSKTMEIPQATSWKRPKAVSSPPNSVAEAVETLGKSKFTAGRQRTRDAIKQPESSTVVVEKAKLLPKHIKDFIALETREEKMAMFEKYSKQIANKKELLEELLNVTYDIKKPPAEARTAAEQVRKVFESLKKLTQERKDLYDYGRSFQKGKVESEINFLKEEIGKFNNNNPKKLTKDQNKANNERLKLLEDEIMPKLEGELKSRAEVFNISDKNTQRELDRLEKKVEELEAKAKVLEAIADRRKK